MLLSRLVLTEAVTDITKWIGPYLFCVHITQLVAWEKLVFQALVLKGEEDKKNRTHWIGFDSSPSRLPRHRPITSRHKGRWLPEVYWQWKKRQIWQPVAFHWLSCFCPTGYLDIEHTLSSLMWQAGIAVNRASSITSHIFWKAIWTHSIVQMETNVILKNIQLKCNAITFFSKCFCDIAGMTYEAH